jgi:hypothetical protein
MKKAIGSVVGIGAVFSTVLVGAVAAPAHAGVGPGGACAVANVNNYAVRVTCPTSVPGTEFRVVVVCGPDDDFVKVGPWVPQGGGSTVSCVTTTWKSVSANSR